MTGGGLLSRLLYATNITHNRTGGGGYFRGYYMLQTLHITETGGGGGGYCPGYFMLQTLHITEPGGGGRYSPCYYTTICYK